jgi:hydroxymethylpyrimidine pyrophosphatase-like HAD family hydrolase
VSGAVKLSVLALDYDGTIAQRDVLDLSAREAIAVARASGIVVLLVTGRTLSELRRVAGDLHFVDGIIAENGAVLHFPQSGHISVVAPLVPPGLRAELERRGIGFHEGQCLIDGDANDASRLLDVIRALEVPVVLNFNGGRVMASPQGVSKATGLRAALNALRLSARNTLAIGDRENDHELLRLAEVGVAVEWGSPALRAAADVVLRGAGPPAVAEYIQRVTATGQLPIPPRARRRLLLGYTDDGREFSLAVRGRNVLIAGDVKSGKSWVTGLLCEQLILHGYCVCVIDPEGDYRSLEALPGVAVLGGEDAPPTPRELLRALRYPDRSLVLDLSHLRHEEKVGYIRTLLPTLNILRRRTGLPHRIVLDEAHYFLRDSDATELLDLDRNGYTLVTYCASGLPKALLAATEVMIITCQSNPVEIDALKQCCRRGLTIDNARFAALGHLRVGQAVALPITEEAGGDLRPFTMGPRLTPHVRHREKYVDMPVTEDRAFLFGANGRSPGRRAQSLREFVAALETLPSRTVEPYLRRGDFSRWIQEVFGDGALAAELRALEAKYRATADTDIVPELVAAVRGRYDLAEEPLELALAGEREIRDPIEGTRVALA